MSEEKKNKIEDELSKIKEEMQELKDMLKQKRGSQPEHGWDDEMGPPGVPGASRHPGFSFKFGSEFDDIDVNLDGIDSTLNDYLESVMKGVSSNIKRSLEGATHGIHKLERDITRKAEREAEREIRRSERDIRRSMRDARKRARKSGVHDSDDHDISRVIHLDKLSEEELEEFYEVGTKMVSALSDPRRLKLLKLLEDGPNYQGDLSEKTGVKGGTFKHHMDSLMESKYVYQEATRGRYLITQLGVEALKLAEMLYRRIKFEEAESSVMKSQEVVDNVEDVADDVVYEVSDQEIENQAENIDPEAAHEEESEQEEEIKGEDEE